jgi:hypothetical protein
MRGAKMFDFVDNQIVRIILELGMAIFTGILGFLGGIKYTNKKNKMGNISNSNIGNIKQEIK